jgi:hypothetical protein
VVANLRRRIGAHSFNVLVREPGGLPDLYCQRIAAFPIRCRDIDDTVVVNIKSNLDLGCSLGYRSLGDRRAWRLSVALKEEELAPLAAPRVLLRSKRPPVFRLVTVGVVGYSSCPAGHSSHRHLRKGVKRTSSISSELTKRQ